MNGEKSFFKFSKWFQNSKNYTDKWRKKARESFDFVEGKQWSEADKAKLKAEGRPAITINKIKPLINILSGYQRTNRYDIDFLPRTNDDLQLCEVRKAMTKYVMDRSTFDQEESTVFINAVICGMGWFEVGYKHDEDISGDGEAFIRSESPFNIYIDPEAKKLDYSDGKYIIRTKWVDREDLIEVYPEQKEYILNKLDGYTQASDGENVDNLYFQGDKNKIRLCECWYKVKEKTIHYLLKDGTQLEVKGNESISEEEKALLELNTIEKSEVVTTEVRVAAFFDDLLLEDIPSPYQHGEFPFVPMIAYHYDEDELPSGVVDSAKDLQRELNKRRSEMLHVVNTSSHGGWMFETEAMTNKQRHDFSRNAAKAGALLEVRDMTKITPLSPPAPPVSIMQAIADSQNDIREVTGINETMMGTSMPNSMSGRAIELKQRQAITHIVPLFDSLRIAKKGIVYLLWGKRSRPGIVPQFYTEEKVYRIEGENHVYEFMTVNQVQQIPTNDPLMPVITRTLNDLSQGEFDIVIADVTATTTQREAQFWSIIDAVSKLAIPGDMVFDLLLDLSNIPHKEELKQRFQERMQQQSQAQEAQMQQQIQLEEIKHNRINKNINIKDVPLPAQLAMLAKEGYVDPMLAQQMMKIYVEAMMPGMTQQQAEINRLQMGNDMSVSEMTPEDMQRQELIKMASRGYGQMNDQRPPATAPASRMTKAALQSVMAGVAPGGMG